MPRAILATPPFTVDPHRRYTIEEWLTIEELTGERYEYHQGKLMSVHAMAGGTGPHALIAGNVMFALGTITRAKDAATQAANGDSGQRGCGVYSSDLRLMIQSEDRYVYPDAAVVCGQPVYDTKVSAAVRNPLVVVEVTSPKSDTFDREDKFDYYATLDSLRDYVLVSQARARVEVRSRAEAGGEWTVTVAEGRDAEAIVTGLEAGLPLAEVYRLVEFG